MVLELLLVDICLGGSGVCLPCLAAIASPSASSSAPSGQVLPFCLAPNGQAAVRAELLLSGLGKQTLARTELAPVHMKTRAKAEMLQETGRGLDVGLQDGEVACLHRSTGAQQAQI